MTPDQSDDALMEKLAGEVNHFESWLVFSFCPTHGIDPDSVPNEGGCFGFTKGLLRCYAERVGELLHFAGLDDRRHGQLPRKYKTGVAADLPDLEISADEKLLRLRDLLEIEAEYSDHLHCKAVPALQLVREMISERARQACEEDEQR